MQMVALCQGLLSIPSRADRQHVELVTGSRLARTVIRNATQCSLPTITDIKRQARRFEDARG